MIVIFESSFVVSIRTNAASDNGLNLTHDCGSQLFGLCDLINYSGYPQAVYRQVATDP